MKLTITNNPTKFQTVKAVDEEGNRYSHSPVLDVTTVVTITGKTATGRSAEEALHKALSN